MRRKGQGRDMPGTRKRKDTAVGQFTDWSSLAQIPPRAPRYVADVVVASATAPTAVFDAGRPIKMTFVMVVVLDASAYVAVFARVCVAAEGRRCWAGEHRAQDPAQDGGS